MNPGPYLKQTLLFLLAVMLPSSALVLLSLRMRHQERELADKRLVERRELAGRRFGESLSRQLREVADPVAELDSEQVRAGEWMALDPSLALVAVVTNDLLILPWEHRPRAEAFAEAARQAPFADALADGQRLEFDEENLPRALARYQEAARLGGLPAQQAFAALAEARVLSKLGVMQEAVNQLELVLSAPLTTRDEFGIPLAFYAAGQLLREGRQLELIFSVMEDAFEPTSAASVPRVLDVSGVLNLSPAATCMGRDYLEELRPRLPAQKEQIDKTLSRLYAQSALWEQAEHLKNDLPVVRAALTREQDDNAAPRRWTVYGAPPWLVAMVALRGTNEPVLVGLKTGDLIERALKTGTLAALDGAPQLVRGPHANGIWMGEEFPDLQVILPPSTFASPGTEPLRLYSVLIVLVVGITLFGAYLWWRDTRRELKLAEIRSDFVSSVSHELKTPLTSVRMLAETLRIREVGAKERNEYLDLILSESERLGRLLKNVLDFSQIEKGTKVYQLKSVKLGPVIGKAVRLVQRPLQEKNLKLAVLSSGADIVLNADGDALEQALLNLLYNAIKYSHKNGRIELRAEGVGHEAVIEVRDHGIGIHPRDHDRIFERFYRAPEEHNRKTPGTGLGLSLVKHIVEQHGGRVTVESAPGQGSTFTIHLRMWRDG